MNTTRIFSTLHAVGLALCLALGFASQPLRAATSGNFTYTDHGSYISIDDYPTGATGAVVIPATIAGKPVTVIGYYAFQNCSSLSSVSIPSGVTSIEGGAFQDCTSLASVSIPSSVTSIGFSGFANCTSLASVNIAAGVTSIGDSAFYNCASLTSINIPAGVTSIGYNVFIYCNHLASITVDPANTSYSGVGGVLFNEAQTTLILYPEGKTNGNYVIPAGVTSIGDSAFRECSGLTGVTLPGSVTDIGVYAFVYCTNLTSVTLPASLTSVGNTAFGYCASLTSITFLGDAPTLGAEVFINAGSGFTVNYDLSKTGFTAPTWQGYASIGNGTSFPLTYKTNGTGVTVTDCDAGYSGVVTIPDSFYGQPITIIGAEAFSNSNSLTGVNIPASVTRLEYFAFAHCPNLTSVSLPASLTSIGIDVFHSCPSLTSVSLPASVTSIEAGAFYGCGLTNVTIPASVTSIGSYAFLYCSNLISATFLGNAPAMGTQAFDGTASGFTVRYDLSKTGFTYPTWNGYPTTIIGTVTDYPFIYTANGTSVIITACDTGYSGLLTIPDSFYGQPVTGIGDSAFYNCKNLTSVSIPASVTSIVGGAFAACGGLTSFAVDSANATYSSLNGVLFDEAQTTLIQYPAGNTNGNYSIPASVTNIRVGAFEDCSSLTGVTIPASVNSIGDYAFVNCSHLTSLSVDPANASYSSVDGVLFDVSQTTLIQYPAGNTNGNYSIPTGVISIESGAFAFCSSLTSVSIPEGVIGIGDHTFSNCGGLTAVSIPASVTEIGDEAFIDCSGLTSATFIGDAPIMEEAVFDGAASGFKVRYDIGKSDFSYPMWNGYPTTIIGTVDDYPLIYAADGTSVTIVGCNINYTGVVTIPDSFYGQPVTGILDGAFTDCSNMTGVTIPASVGSIGFDAFYNCASLTSVTIPSNSSLTGIGDRAFFACASLAGVTIPASVTSVGQEAFFYCSGLTSVTIPASVTSIGENAFAICESLTSAIFLGNAPTMGTNVFGDTADGFKMYYIDGKAGFGSIGYPTGFQGGEIAIQQPVGTNLNDGGVKSFGSVLAGASSSLTFTIKNLGNENLTGLTITKNGIHASAFTVTQNPIAPVAPGGSTTFTVRFAPGTTGAKTAALHIASNDANESPFDINLSGTGTAPEISVDSIADGGSMSYGSVMTGSNKSLTYTIRNTGTGNLSGISITKNGTHAADFAITTAPAASVAPGGKTTFVVKFTPGAIGNRSASIHIAHNDSNEKPFDINLSGSGIAPEIAVQQPLGTNIPDAGSKSYGKVAIGSGKSLTYTIKNTGTANLTGIVITKNGANAADFKVMRAPATTVAPGGKTTFVVKFTPKTTGSRSAAIHIANNDSNEKPFDIKLSGTGIAAIKSAGSMNLASGLLATTPTTKPADKSKTVITVDAADGLKYQTLVVMKAPGTADLSRPVEVSSNLMDWYSGRNHTTVLRNDAKVLKVRDNTPLTSETKRYIRLRKPKP